MCCWGLGQRNSVHEVNQYKPYELFLVLGQVILVTITQIASLSSQVSFRYAQ